MNAALLAGIQGAQLKKVSSVKTNENKEKERQEQLRKQFLEEKETQLDSDEQSGGGEEESVPEDCRAYKEIAMNCDPDRVLERVYKVNMNDLASIDSALTNPKLTSTKLKSMLQEKRASTEQRQKISSWTSENDMKNAQAFWEMALLQSYKTNPLSRSILKKNVFPYFEQNLSSIEKELKSNKYFYDLVRLSISKTDDVHKKYPPGKLHPGINVSALVYGSPGINGGERKIRAFLYMLPKRFMPDNGGQKEDVRKNLIKNIMLYPQKFKQVYGVFAGLGAKPFQYQSGKTNLYKNTVLLSNDNSVQTPQKREGAKKFALLYGKKVSRKRKSKRNSRRKKASRKSRKKKKRTRKGRTRRRRRSKKKKRARRFSESRMKRMRKTITESMRNLVSRKKTKVHPVQPKPEQQIQNEDVIGQAIEQASLRAKEENLLEQVRLEQENERLRKQSLARRVDLQGNQMVNELLSSTGNITDDEKNRYNNELRTILDKDFIHQLHVEY